MAQASTQLIGHNLSDNALRTVTAVESDANLDDATFKATPDLRIAGATAIFLQAALPGASDSVGVIPVYYDEDGDPIATGAEVTLASPSATAPRCDVNNASGTADANQYIAAAEIDVVPGAFTLRLFVATFSSSGDIHLFAAYTPDEGR